MGAPIHVTVWGAAAATVAPAVVLIHGSMTWGTACFERQRALASHYQMLVVDRRGYGASPDVDHSDYEVDAADVLELLGDAAHLVGHSYGGVVAMLAASRRPQAVRSLALIEPAAFRLAVDDPIVAGALEQLRLAVATTPSDPSPAAYLRLSAQVMGVLQPQFTPDHLRAARSALHERPSWDAEVPIEPLTAAGWPKLVITGTWETASPAYRTSIGEAMMACGRIVAHRIGATLVRVAGAAHEPHREQPVAVNSALTELWGQASPGAGPPGPKTLSGANQEQPRS